MLATFEHLGKEVSLHGLERDHIFRTIQRSGTFYEIEMLEYIAALEPSGTIVDVGSHIGNHAVFFGLFTPAQKVIAVEPQTRVADFLEQNIASNGLDQKITHITCALGATAAKVGLKAGPARNPGNTKITEHGAIPQQPLSEVVGDEPVSLVKIDVEGYECEVLQGARELLEAQRPLLFVEASNPLRRWRLNRFLKDFDYSAGAVFNNTPTYFYYPDEQAA